ncbi:MAG: hypothetical protein FWH47_01935 [Methanomassiliicoccaceae archaeon]|nr:hypothetical protein [Methanomassiliicoccaceae archaeon]
MRLIDCPECGPACRFEDAHLYYMLAKLDKERPISRLRLAEEIGVGEGSIRKMISIMKEWGAVTVVQTGITVSERGCGLLRRIPIDIVDTERSEYVIGAYQQGVLARGTADKITNGAYQRDKGIATGASGASVFVIRDGALIMPKNWNMDVKDPEFAEKLRGKGMGEGDTMIICGANSQNTAVISAISIALDLL